jgi:acyl dehydratase
VNLASARQGASVESDAFPVTAERIVAYAKAINDTDPRHLAGTLAPPLFAVVPALKTLVRPKKEVTAAHALHGEHDLVVHAAIVPGMILHTRAAVVGVRPSPAGALIVTRGETRTAGGALVNEQYLTSLVRGEAVAERIGAEPPDHRMPDGLTVRPSGARVTYELDADQTRRYAEASGDRDAYTYDDAYARSLGYPGPIVHGLCTMAFAGRAIIERCGGGDSTRLRRLAVRFSRLLLMRPGQLLTTVIWEAGGRAGRRLFAFEARDADGTTVITHGWAEVAEPTKTARRGEQ